MAIIAVATEKIIAPRPRPEPFLSAYNQNELAITYEISDAMAYQAMFLIDQVLAKTSAIISNVIRRMRGNIHDILSNKVNYKSFFISSNFTLSISPFA